MTPRRILPLLFAAATLAGVSTTRASSVITIQAGLNQVSDVLVDPAGNVFVTQRSPSNAVLRFPAGSNVSSVFATGFGDPAGIARDSQDNLFVANHATHSVSKVTPGGAVTTFATGITNPGAIVIDPSNNLYVGEYYSQAVKKITPAGVVSSYGAAALGSGSGTTRRLTAMCWEPDGTILCGTFGPADGTGPYPITRIPAAGGTATSVVVSALPITGIARGPLGEHYFACYQRHTIARSTLPAAPVLYAGANLVPGLVNSTLLASRFNFPAGIAVDNTTGNIFITDTINDAVRAIVDAETGPTSTVSTSWGRVKGLYHR